MAAEVGQQFSGWSYSDLPYNDHCTQDASVQQMVLDHGSVSFGRFAEESLSWENRSVFAHDRRQEELSKLTLPGLVAQKKAFFEEYYKRARRLKAQEAVHQTEATLEEKSDNDTLDHSRQEDKLPAVISEDPVASAPSSSFEPSTGVSSSDEKKCQEPHGLGYLTFNPLFSQITGLQNIQQEEGSSTDQKQYVDGEFPCATHISSKHGLNRETQERKVLAPKHVVSTDNGESNAAVSRIVLPIASVHSEGLKVGLEKQETRKNVAVITRLTKGSKDPTTTHIHIPRVDLRRNSENRNSQDLKDPFDKRVEMKLRALSDRMSTDRSAASSKSVSYQHADRATTSCRSYSYENADRVATSSRSALCPNVDRVFAASKSAAPASHKSFKEVQRVATLPRAIFFNKGSHVSHVASSNSSTTGKLAAKSSVVPNSSQINAKTFRTAQVTSKRAAGTSVRNGSQYKRKQLSTPAASDENNLNRGYMRISAPPSARSGSNNLLPYKTAQAPKISNGENMVKKPTYRSHPVGGRSVVPKHPLNCNEQNRKVISSYPGSLSSSMRNNLTCGLSLRKSKPSQILQTREATMAVTRPRWR